MGLGDILLDASIFGSFDRGGFARHRRLFGADDLSVDLTRKVAIVTGANSGIGRETTRYLAGRGATVWMFCRSVERAETARAELRAENAAVDLGIRVVDMADQKSIRKAVSGIKDVDILVHNAGLLVDRKVTSVDRFELTLATHVLGPHLLTKLLRPTLRPGARVIWVSSGGMYTVKLDVSAIFRPDDPFDGVKAYARCKRAQVVLSEMWAKELERSRVHVHAMHPGWADTPAVQHSLPRFWSLMKGRLRTPAEGADTVCFLAAGAAAGRTSGQFWFDRAAKPTHMLPWTKEPWTEREALWKLCESATDDPPKIFGA